jgi:fructokinase
MLSNCRSVLLGEVLLDVFPSGQVVQGGAPFNIAWHLQGFGSNPLLITRIGADDHGHALLQAMQDWGMEVSGVQIDAIHPTGTVQVSLHNGQPSFEILTHQAYDFIAADPALDVIDQHPCFLLYHGTLATRSPFARQTLQTLQARSGLPIYLDLNLRDPWWDRAWVDQVLAAARWVKVNDAELAVVMGQSSSGQQDLCQQAQSLRHRFDHQLLVVTQGSEGALLVLPDRVIQGAAVPLQTIVDTVGAGDAFSAVIILGLQNHWPMSVALERALQFAAAICQMPGGTCADPQFYAYYRDQWVDKEEILG